MLKLPFGLKIRWQGRIKWRGKQGRLEIVYDDLSGRWYAFQPVEVEPLHQPIGDKRAYLDLGVGVLIMAEIHGEITGYGGNSPLADWWYWTKKIAEHQRRLKKVNDKHASKRLRKLHRKRKRRFGHSMNTIVGRSVELCYNKGVSEIVVGDLNGIRSIRIRSKRSIRIRSIRIRSIRIRSIRIRSNNSKCKKANSMIHNFWSHRYRYLIKRIKEKAEEYCTKVTEVKESYTSSLCPRCGSKNVEKRKRCSNA